jgi:polysaccharide biosynthesis transport protein
VQDQTPETSDPSFDVRDLWFQFTRQKWVILGTLVVISVGTLLVALSLDKVYKADATLEYDPAPPRPLGSNVEGIENSGATFLLAKEWYQTQNRIIASKRILGKVVDRLGLNRDAEFMEVPPKKRGTWKGATRDAAIDMLSKSLKVQQEKETRIVKLELESTDPQKAALLANTLSDAYISWVMEERMSSTVKAVEWLSGQLDDISKRLETSEMAIYTFRRTNNVLSVSLGDQQNVVSSTYQSFSQAATEAEKRRIEVSARLADLKASNRDDPFDVYGRLFTASNAVQALRLRYHESIVERETMATKYGSNHPSLASVQKRIDSLIAEARQEVDGLIRATESELFEMDKLLAGMRAAKQRAQDEGLALNLREIEYNQLERQRENTEKLHTMLLQRTAETNLTRMFQAAPVRIVDTASVPNGPIRPRVGLATLLGAFIGLAAGLGLAILRTRMDRSISGPDDIEAARVHMLGLVPAIASDPSANLAGAYGAGRRRRPAMEEAQVNKDLIVHSHPRSMAAECCRTIRTNLSFMSPDKPLRTVLITSPGPSEGKTTMAISLAITMAQSGRRTLLVDTDLRRPRVHRVFGQNLTHGITPYLVGEAALEDGIITTEVANLWVMPSGPIPPNPAELMHTARFARVLEELKERFDLILLDSPPVGAVTDAAIAAPQVDGVVLVVRADRTTRDTLANAVRQLKDVKANLLGVVLNEADLSRRRAYKGYYYGAYYTTPEDGGPGVGGDSGPGPNTGGTGAAGTSETPPARGPILDRA